MLGLMQLIKKVKKRTSSMGSGLTLTNDELKEIIKVIRSLENRELWKIYQSKRRISQLS